MASSIKFFALLPLLLAMACHRDNSSDLPAFRITGLSAEPVRIVQLDTLQGKMEFKHFATQHAIPSSLLGIKFRSKISLLANQSIPEVKRDELLKTLYQEGIFSSDSIAEISVYSDNDFSTNFKAGDNLNDKFSILVNNTGLDGNQLQVISLNEFLKHPQHGRTSFTLLLNESPSAELQHKFVIHYRKEDNSLYVVTLPKLSFDIGIYCQNDHETPTFVGN